MQEIDQRDRELLAALQGDTPLVSTPFAFSGQSIDMSEKEVIKRTERLRRDGVIRSFCAHFDARALGYRSRLVAARVPADTIDDAAAAISAHPGVTANYKGHHDFNLWFTIAGPPSSRLGLEKTIELLGEEAECDAIRPLPTLRQYKHSGESEESGEDKYVPLTPKEVECVRLLQHDLPLQPRPFDAMAKNNNVTSDELLATMKALLARGQMRHFGAFIQQRKTGFSSSAMAVWVVPESLVDEVGAKMSQNRAVSHCYLPPTYGDWPYNLYAIGHGRSVDECESIINDLSIDTGITGTQALYPTKEYKKSRLTFFAPEADEWESAHSGQRAATTAS